MSRKLWLAVSLSGLASLQVQAQTAMRIEYVQPKYLWAISTGVRGLYDSATEVFGAYQDYLASASNQNAISTAYNLRPSPTVYTVNGIAIDYLWDMSFVFPPQPTQNYTVVGTGTVFAYEVCPLNWSSHWDYNVPGAYRMWCGHQISTPLPPKDACPVGNPVYPESGLKEQVEVDYEAASKVLRIARTYRSDVGTFSTVMDARFVDFSLPAVSYNECRGERYLRTYDVNGAPVYGYYCFQIVAPNIQSALLTKPSGVKVGFGVLNGAYTPNANVDDRVVQSSQNPPMWQSRGDENTLSVYSTFGLQSTTSLHGQSVTYSYSDTTTPPSVAPHPGLMIAATDTFGRSLQFGYGPSGLLSQMTDPAGEVFVYQYDISTVKPASVQYPDGSIRQYTWNEAALTSGTSQPGALTGITEIWPASGSSPATTVRAGSYGYSGSGLAISTARAAGLDLYTMQNAGTQVSVTDPLGTQRVTNYQTLFDTTYAASRSQPGGAGCAASTSASTYDASGNTTSRDDFDGNRACFVSDSSRNLESVRIEGLSNAVACASVTPTGAVLPAASRKISRLWHPSWRVETKRAEPLKLTTWVYNGQPDPLNGGAVANCAPLGALLPDGSPIAVLCKQVEQATSDADGHLGFSATLQAGGPNRVRQWTYSQYGQVLTAKGPRTDVDDTTNYAYYATTTANYTTGDLSSVTNAALQTTQFPLYNKHGQVLRSIDPNGVVTDNTYDLRQRLTSTTVGGQQTVYTYDLAGQLTQLQLPDTTTITYTYDPAHRLTKVTDQAGNSVTYTLDNAGNRTQDQIKDPSGTLARTITRAFDALGRVQQMSGVGQ